MYLATIICYLTQEISVLHLLNYFPVTEACSSTTLVIPLLHAHHRYCFNLAEYSPGGNDMWASPFREDLFETCFSNVRILRQSQPTLIFCIA